MTVSPTTLFLAIAACAVLIGLMALLRGSNAIRPAFEKRPLLNKSEQRVFDILRSELPDDWTAMCQVSYGSFLKNKSFKRYMTINSKRADFILVRPDLSVAAVIEYQGSGHFGNTPKKRDQVSTSDKAKRQALNEADLPLFEAPAKQYQEALRQFVQSTVSPKEPSSDGEKLSVIVTPVKL